MGKIFTKFTSGLAAAVMTVTSAGVTTTGSMIADAAGGGDDYARLLQYSMYFYDANYCGPKAGERSRLTWRGTCHTNDGVVGGFHDAGDHVKFGLPAGYTASNLGWSYYEFGDAFRSTGQAAHLQEITDHFAEFFRASTTLSGNTVTRFVYQVGDGDRDHGYWRSPEVDNDSSTRTVLSTTTGASDIAAQYAASLALNYINFGNEEDLKYAKALYDYSVRTNTITGAPGFYESTSLEDDQAWAAGWLYMATKENYYKEQCTSKRPEVYWYNGWDNNALGANCVYGYVTGDWSKAENYLRGQCRGSEYKFADAWGSARYNTELQFCALAVSRHTSSDFSSWAKGQMDYILGNKGVGSASPVCFVVGFADNSAKYPHHRAASGFGSMGEFGGSSGAYSSSGHVIPGALVGGPTDESGAYVDSVKDYQANEVALDYNVGLVGAAAGLYAAYGTGSVVPVSQIPEAKTGTNDPVVTGDPAVTTTRATNSPAVTTTAAPVIVTPGVRKKEINAVHQVNGSDQWESWYWFEFDLAQNETVSKVEVEIEGTNGNIGQWQGAFGTISKSGDWMQTDNIVKDFGSSGIVTWEISDSDSKIINYDSGELKFGTWWSSSQSFVVKSVTLYTNSETPVTTAKPTTTVKLTTTAKPTTTIAPTTTVKPTTTAVPTTTVKLTTTAKPTTTAAPTTTVKLTTTAKPTTTAAPTTTVKLTTTAKPTTTAAPTTTVKLTTTAKPVTTAAPTTTVKLTTTAKPTTTAAPTTTVKLTTTAKPTTTVAPTTTAKPVTTVPIPIPADLKGDVNGDGAVNVADLVAMCNYLLGNGKIAGSDQRSADVDNSGSINAFDLALLRKIVINDMKKSSNS